MDVPKMSYLTSPADAYLILGRLVLRQQRSDSDAAAPLRKATGVKNN
jgi:hypothetical protein